jgi:hypothetical protein
VGWVLGLGGLCWWWWRQRRRWRRWWQLWPVAAKAVATAAVAAVVVVGRSTHFLLIFRPFGLPSRPFWWGATSSSASEV